MLLLRRMSPMGSFLLTFMALSLLQSVLFAPQSATLSSRDFKALLKAGKVVEIGLGERTISGRLTTAGLEGLLPKEKIAELQQFGQGGQRFTTVKLDDVTLIPELEAAGVQFQGQIENH
jgi:cell division protease FtsH